MSNFGTVNYTGLEPIVNSGASTDRVVGQFEFQNLSLWHAAGNSFNDVTDRVVS